EDGIRGFHVTGVQTCALPIWRQAMAGGAALVGQQQRRGAVVHARSVAGGNRAALAHHAFQACQRLAAGLAGMLVLGHHDGVAFLLGDGDRRDIALEHVILFHAGGLLLSGQGERSPFFWGIETGVISASNTPSSCARAVFSWLARANLSWSSRLILKSSATFSAVSGMESTPYCAFMSLLTKRQPMVVS